MRNPFQNAMAQLDKVSKIKNFGLSAQAENDFIACLREPNRDIRISIPVKMDNGFLKIFEGRIKVSRISGNLPIILFIGSRPREELQNLELFHLSERVYSIRPKHFQISKRRPWFL